MDYLALAIGMSRAEAAHVLAKAPSKRERGDFDTDVHGIPCQVVVDSCEVTKGSFSRNAPSDVDYYGYAEVSFHLIDRRGYRANWLHDKLTPADVERIESEILNHRED